MITDKQVKAAIKALSMKAVLEAAEVAAWLSTDELLPPPHKDVWCLNRCGRQFQGRVCYGAHAPFFTIPHGDGNASNTAPSWIDVTHWRPLPAPPKEPE